MLYGLLRRLVRNVYDGFGLYDFPDNNTAPVSITAGSSAYVVSDNEGTFRLPESKFEGVDTLYNGATGEFDFSSLPLGTVIEFRGDIAVTTSGANTNLDLVLEAGIGSGGEVELAMGNTIFHTIAGTKHILPYQMIVVGSDNTRNYPAKLKMYSDKDVKFTVNGFTLNIRKPFDEPARF